VEMRPANEVAPRREGMGDIVWARRQFREGCRARSLLICQSVIGKLTARPHRPARMDRKTIGSARRSELFGSSCAVIASLAERLSADEPMNRPSG